MDWGIHRVMMAGVDESSGVREDGVFTDVPVDTEQLVSYTSIAPAAPHSESDPDDKVEETEDEDLEEDPIAENDEPAEYADDMGTTAGDIIDDLTNKNEELENRVTQLEDKLTEVEEENQTLQDTEDQYKSLAYQSLGEKAELAAKLGQSELELAGLKVEYEVLKAKHGLVIAERDRINEAWSRAARRADQLDSMVQTGAVRIETLGLALDAAYEGQKDRNKRYSVEEGQTSRSVRCRLMD